LPEYDFGGADAQGDVLIAEVGVDPQPGSVNGPVDILGETC